jgi:AmmeMemoRadiSam system protein B
MPAIRPAAVAGSFYPGEASALAAEVTSHVASAPEIPTARPPKAIIAPHAGYIYSGPIAGSVYARLLPLAGRIRRVVLAGPAHRVYVHGVAVPAAREFETPLGPVPLDLAAIARARELPFVEVSDKAHALEHSLEVHLPFLQAVLGDFRLVPLVVGDAAPDEMARLLELLWGGDETLVVVSSDLSHYLPYDSARARDGGTARAILDLDATLVPEDACGAAPINGLLAVARRRGLEPELVDLRNSGDTAGSRDRVVGYGAFAFHEARAPEPIPPEPKYG